MRNIFRSVALLIISLPLLSSCESDEKIYDHPFVYIKNRTGASTSTINPAGEVTEPYTVFLSSKFLGEDITVDYQVVAGDGLQQDVDYRLVASTASPLTFPAGTFKREIRIQWLRHAIDASKDNTLTIRLTGCSRSGVTLGMPGPDHHFIEHTVTKKSLE